MKIDFEITYRGETVNLDETASQMVVSFTLYDGNFPNGGSGAVSSVNGKTGAVVLDASDIAETSTLKWLTSTLKGYYDTAYNWVNTNGSSVLQSISDLQTAIGNRYTKSETDNLLNNKVDKVSGKGLSENDLTNALKSSYDSAVTDKHTHGNKSILDLIEQPLTTALKATYDGYGSQISAKANTADVEIILFKSSTTTVVTGKTLETSIYSIPLPNDGFNYIIEIYSQAQITTFAGAGITQRFRVGTYASPIDGSTGANSIGLQTALATNGAAGTTQIELLRRYKYSGGASGSIYGLATGSNISDDANTIGAFTTLRSTDLTVQNYLYVTFNPSSASAVISHSMITVKLIKI